ncbi:hypothetical protein JCM10212_001396 [Sporobolomyces blumeae]
MPRPGPTRPTVQHNGSGASGSSSDGAPPKSPKPRRKSFAHTEKEVVTTDMLHPDWEAKLEAMKATVARRANRRIVFRQVGDRLVPVGITSGRSSDGANATMATQTLPPDFLSQIAAALDNSNNEGGSGSRSGSSSGFRVRSSRRRRGSSQGGGNDEVAQLLESLGLGGGPDLEEMMLQEAMRLSQLEEEERQKKVREEEAKRAAEQGGAAGGSASAPLSRDPKSQGTTERELSEAMGGSLGGDSPAAPATTTFPAASSSAPSSHPASPRTSTSTARPPVLDTSIPNSSLTGQRSPSTPSTSATPTATTFPTGGPSLAPIATTSDLAPTVSRASDASSVMQPAPMEGYQPLGDESDAESRVSVSAAATSVSPSAQDKSGGSSREHVERPTPSGNLIDF